MPSLDYYSPPTSPKYGRSYRPKQSRSLLWHIQHHQNRILVGLVLLLVAYYTTHHHQPLFRPKHAPSLRYKNVNWRLYAYSQYATDSSYLCSAVMVFEALDRLGSKAERILMYPDHWDTVISDGADRDSQLLVKARDEYGVKLIPVKVQEIKKSGEADKGSGVDACDYGITKFLAFNQTQYLRIIHVDSDATVLKHMDDLFLLPHAPVAATRAYWKLPSVTTLSTLFFMLEPSNTEAEELFSVAKSPKRQKDHYDMEIFNEAYKDSAMVLPHRRLGLLTNEFRADDHARFLGNKHEKWDPDRALREASLVHFSDWPLPKPWIMWPAQLLQELLPLCEHNPGTKKESGCRNREIWKELYDDYRKRRKRVCALLSYPAPEWPPRQVGNVTITGGGQ